MLRKKSSTIILLQILAICAPLCAQNLQSDARFEQFENSGEYVANNRIDALVMKTFRSKGIEPANLCSDAVFIRRVYLDVIGTLPEPQERRFASFCRTAVPVSVLRLLTNS